MVILENKDRYIFNLHEKIADIIYEFQTTNEVLICTNSEGICLQSAGFYNLLDYISSKFQIPKKSITVLTSNAEEKHNEYNVTFTRNHWIDQSKSFFKLNVLPKSNKLKVLGCFIGKPNWNRLVIAAWLNKNYKSKTLMTCHYDPTQERHKIDSELTDVNLLANEELATVVDFLSQCPLVLEEGFLNYTIGPPTHYNILSQYHNIFLDLIVETYVSGLSFFPTEKTLRPIIAKTPFIAMGPQGYLANLQRLGFKTFSKWWSEDYDNYSDYQRILQIREILIDIFSWSDENIKKVLNEMEEILIHNRSLAKEITGNSVFLPR